MSATRCAGPLTARQQVSNASAEPFAEAAELPNVRLVEWVDQNAVLAHPALGLFLTHGGHNSVSEAAFHGVPMLAVAIFGDQWDSAGRAVANGFAELLDKRKLTPEAVKEQVLKLLDDERYKQAAARMSRGMKLFRSRRHPVEVAADLVEDNLEAVRSDAASSPLPLPPLRWWQSRQVDVHLALALLLALAGWALRSLISCCCGVWSRCCCKTRSQSTPILPADGVDAKPKAQ
mmetsp:Transcript_33329/g.83962  ORF Transcript_33329/g.83962 Transcript_33329/m.83962 type:complete len:233 (+) Transcript_33329:119-817(+)